MQKFRAAESNPEFFLPTHVVDTARQRFNERAIIDVHDLHIENFAKNAETCRLTRTFEFVTRHGPAVIVGAGPSLDRHTKILEGLGNEVTLITCDAALPVLMRHNITPDFVCVVDPTPKQVNNFADFRPGPLTQTLLPSVVHPSVVSAASCGAFSFYNFLDDRNPTLRLIRKLTPELPTFIPGALTSATCLQLAERLKCSSIIFIGHDLSWPSPDKTYASGISDIKEFFQRDVKFKSDCLLFPDIHGDLVLTHLTFIVFWAWLRDYLKDKHLNVINASEAGILHMDGVEVMPLEKALSLKEVPTHG